MKDHFSDLTLEQYLLDELSESVRVKLEVALSRDPELRQRIERLRNSNQQILSEADKDEVVAQIRMRLKNREINRELKLSEQKRPVRSRWIYALPALALAVVTLNVIVPMQKNNIGVITEDGVRIKGLKPAIHIYQKTDRGVTLLEDRVAVKKGDALQIAYVAAGLQYGMIVSVDGNNAVTLHYPYQETAEPKLERDGEVALERSYELDDAPKFERFFFISSDAAFAVTPLMEKIKAMAAKQDLSKESIIAGLPAAMNQTSQVLTKVTP